MSFIYGPVPSRRLGISLGIDIVPSLTCTFDCVYCQLGKTKNKVRDWTDIKFPSTEKILKNVKYHIEKYSTVDFITISGSGEPTLNPDLGEIAERIRTLTNIPLALITNSSLLTYEYVLNNVKKFDIVMPSLDAGDNKTFKTINRPAKGFDINEITKAIKRLRQESKSEIWLEVMLIKGRITNASSESITNITKKVCEILPSMVFLNSPVRPPSESWVEPLTDHEMEKVKFKMEAEIPQDVDIQIVSKVSQSKSQILNKKDVSNEILRLLSVRPCTSQEISNTMGININEVGKYIERLLNTGKISVRTSNNEIYYMRQMK